MSEKACNGMWVQEQGCARLPSVKRRHILTYLVVPDGVVVENN